MPSECDLVKLALMEADDMSAENLDKTMKRLKGKILNLFEAIITDKKQLTAIKRLLQSLLNDVIVTDTRQATRAELLSIARKFGCDDIKFKPLDEYSEEN